VLVLLLILTEQLLLIVGKVTFPINNHVPGKSDMDENVFHDALDDVDTAVEINVLPSWVPEEEGAEPNGLG